MGRKRGIWQALIIPATFSLDISGWKVYNKSMEILEALTMLRNSYAKDKAKGFTVAEINITQFLAVLNATIEYIEALEKLANDFGDFEKFRESLREVEKENTNVEL